MSSSSFVKLDSLEVVHAGADAFPLARKVRAVPLARLLELIRPLAWLASLRQQEEVSAIH